jgi:hypothetical protein
MGNRPRMQHFVAARRAERAARSQHLPENGTPRLYRDRRGETRNKTLHDQNSSCSSIEYRVAIQLWIHQE